MIVYPTWYSGQHYDNEWLIGEGMALDPSRYFIIIPNMLGNGLSSSPSNTPPPYDMLWTWQNGDIRANDVYKGDFAAALDAIRAKAIVMPGRTDLYFPPEDSEYEVAHLANAELRPMSSIWGHFAGGPGLNPEDVQFPDRALKELLRD